MFIKGDPNINRKGRPKNFDKLRSLALQLSNELARSTDGDFVLSPSGLAMTNIEVVLRRMMVDLPEKFVEISYGKIPNEVKLTGGVQIVLAWPEDSLDSH